MHCTVGRDVTCQCTTGRDVTAGSHGQGPKMCTQSKGLEWRPGSRMAVSRGRRSRRQCRRRPRPSCPPPYPPATLYTAPPVQYNASTGLRSSTRVPSQYGLRAQYSTASTGEGVSGFSFRALNFGVSGGR
eukprot:1907154-Rhodomonas_salina.1